MKIVVRVKLRISYEICASTSGGCDVVRHERPFISRKSSVVTQVIYDVIVAVAERYSRYLPDLYPIKIGVIHTGVVCYPEVGNNYAAGRRAMIWVHLDSSWIPIQRRVTNEANVIVYLNAVYVACEVDKDARISEALKCVVVNL